MLGPDGAVVPDLKEKLPGRGVWLTAAHDVVAEAAKRNVFARALKAKPRFPRACRPRSIGCWSKRRSALALANKAGEVVFGTAKVEEAIAKGRVRRSSMRGTRPKTAAASSTAKPAEWREGARSRRSAPLAWMN